MNLFDDIERQVQDKSRRLAADLPDLHNEQPAIQIPVTAGLVNVQKWIKVSVGRERVALLSNIEAFVDLPSSIRGLNLSRHNEAITEVVNAHATNRKAALESMAAEISVKLLEKHDYASRACVLIMSKYPYVTRTIVGFPSQQVCDIEVSAEAERDKDQIRIVQNSVAVTIRCAVACPLGQEMLRSHTIAEIVSSRSQRYDKELRQVMKNIPFGTHMDRSFSRVELRFPTCAPGACIYDLIDVLESSAVAPFREMLKRPDELILLDKMLKSPVFAEDCVRQMARELTRRFPQIPGDTEVFICQTSEFTLSAYNVVAKKCATIANLRGELGEF